jgi:hypothetical protein
MLEVLPALSMFLLYTFAYTFGIKILLRIPPEPSNKTKLRAK